MFIRGDSSMIRSFAPLRSLALSLAVIAIAATGAPVVASAQTLPAADQLISRFVEAVGGREAVLRPRVSQTTGMFEMPAAGLKAEIIIVSQAPDRMASKMTIPGLGEMRTGYDGNIGWSLDPMSGARIMQGTELDAIREQSMALASVRDASLFRSRETVERTEVGGKACYRVKLVWQSGRESFDCYGADDGLLVGTWSQTESPMGKVDVATRIEEYGEFGGLKIPVRTVQEMMGMQQIITIVSIDYENVDVSLLDPPAEIRALSGSNP
jgi:hypothetical protein